MTKRETFPVAVVIPSLNPDEKLKRTVEGCFRAGFSDVILVDDGSRPDCRRIFEELEGLEGCTVLRHAVNRGKGRALKTAFGWYLERFDQERFSGVVTADADGQHLPEDILRTAQALLRVGKEEKALILGTRDFDRENVPFKSRNGNKITTNVFQLLYGRRVRDTQTGLRAISNAYIPDCLELDGERFEYEIHMLIDAVLQKARLEEVLIETVYFDDNRETHFHPVKDSARIYGVMFAAFVRFSCSGLASMLVDQGLFALFQKVVLAGLAGTAAIPLATFAARACSSYLNYSLNRTLVFRSGAGDGRVLARYYGLCLAQMAASAAGVTLLHLLTAVDPSWLKLLVDGLLFLVSYQVQQRWVFRGKRT